MKPGTRSELLVACRPCAAGHRVHYPSPTARKSESERYTRVFGTVYVLYRKHEGDWVAFDGDKYFPFRGPVLSELFEKLAEEVEFENFHQSDWWKIEREVPANLADAFREALTQRGERWEED